MYFYLKKPNEEKVTGIDLIHYVKDEPSSNKNFKYSTKQKILPSEWDFENRYPKSKRGTSGKKNKQIALELDKFKRLLENTITDFQRNDRPLTKADLRMIFDRKFKHNYQKKDCPIVLKDAIEFYIDTKTKNDKPSKAWLTINNNLRKKVTLYDIYRERTTLFGDLNQDWLEGYCGFLRNFNSLVDKKKAKELNAQVQSNNNYNDNTLYGHLKILFGFLDWAKENYEIKVKKLKNTIKTYPTGRVHLTDEEVELLENVELEDTLQDTVRDLFLIGIYSGQRFSDYSVFEKEDVVKTPDGDMIIKKSQKTVRESFIPITPDLDGLLEKYNWKLPYVHKDDFNIEIKQICKKAGINSSQKKMRKKGSEKKVTYYDKWEGISTHTARRTFITLSAERGMPDHIIMAVTGISKPETLQKYKKTSQESVSRYMFKAWSKKSA